MTSVELNCPNCGAVKDYSRCSCEYCGTPYHGRFVTTDRVNELEEENHQLDYEERYRLAMETFRNSLTQEDIDRITCRVARGQRVYF